MIDLGQWASESYRVASEDKDEPKDAGLETPDER